MGYTTPQRPYRCKHLYLNNGYILEWLLVKMRASDHEPELSRKSETKVFVNPRSLN